MFKRFLAPIIAITVLLLFGRSAHADDYTVPVIIDDTTYTLTITIEGAVVSVTSADDALVVGPVNPVIDEAKADEALTLEGQKASAESIDYDDLFRYNEDHVGKLVRYVGQVLQVEECQICVDDLAVLRIAVTEDRFGLWDDPIWVEYMGPDRFLEDDIITVWGTVEGLHTYETIFGETVTIPAITALDMVLGEVENPTIDTEDTDATSATADTPASIPDGAYANRNANLRGGPGTDYPVVGGVKTNDPVTAVARNDDATWVQLDTDAWIAAHLLDNLGDASELPVVDDIPAPPEPPASAPSTAETGAASPAPTGGYAIGDEIQSNGWRFNVKEVHKRKAVYFYDDGHIAMGNWLVVIMDAVNEQSGTDYLQRSLRTSLSDGNGRTYTEDFKASSYAEWQFGGLSSVYTDVDPGKLARIAMAFDLPEDTSAVTLRIGNAVRVNLGNVAEMPIEE